MNLDTIELLDIQNIELLPTQITITKKNEEVISMQYDKPSDVLQRISYLNRRYASQIECLDSAFEHKRVKKAYKQLLHDIDVKNENRTKKMAIFSIIPAFVLIFSSIVYFPQFTFLLTVLYSVGLIGSNTFLNIREHIKQRTNFMKTVDHSKDLQQLQQDYNKFLQKANTFLVELEQQSELSESEELKVAHNDIALFMESAQTITELPKKRILRRK